MFLLALLLIYLKCIWTNPYARYSYMGTIVGSCMHIFFESKKEALFSLLGLFIYAIALLILVESLFGLGTMLGYQRARRTIALYGPSDVEDYMILDPQPKIPGYVIWLRLALNEHFAQMARSY